MTPNELPFVSVVVPHKGPEEPLVSCLEALRRQTYSKDSFEVIVVRNEPDNLPPPCDLDPNETFLWQPNGCSYAARNLGIENSSGSIIALTDSDAVPEERWIEEGVASFRKGIDLVAGEIALNFSSNVLSSAACYEKLFAFDQEKNVRWGMSTTANLFVLRTVFIELGGFNPEAVSGGDFEWTSRAVKSGLRMFYSPTAIVHHPARETWAAVRQKAYRTSLGSHRVLKRLGFFGLTKRFYFRYLTLPSFKRTRHLSLVQQVKGFSVRFALTVCVVGSFFSKHGGPFRGTLKG